MKLKSAAYVTPYVHLACIPSKITERPRQQCYIAGWGRLSGTLNLWCFLSVPFFHLSFDPSYSKSVLACAWEFLVNNQIFQCCRWLIVVNWVLFSFMMNADVSFIYKSKVNTNSCWNSDVYKAKRLTRIWSRSAVFSNLPHSHPLW